MEAIKKLRDNNIFNDQSIVESAIVKSWMGSPVIKNALLRVRKVREDHCICEELGEADGKTLISREKDQYNSYLIKTSLPIDDPQIEDIAQTIEEFTNTNGDGYRSLAGDNFFVASSSLTYSRIESTLEMTNRIGSFLQIYVTFGLVIGAVGMGVISVRNVSERKREIGMMRAIGFPRAQVILSVLLELVVLGIIGLLIGIANGLLVSLGFANMLGVTLVIPWEEIGLYLSIIVLIALGSGSLPALVASRIPPARSRQG